MRAWRRSCNLSTGRAGGQACSTSVPTGGVYDSGLQVLQVFFTPGVGGGTLVAVRWEVLLDGVPEGIVGIETDVDRARITLFNWPVSVTCTVSYDGLDNVFKGDDGLAVCAFSGFDVPVT